MSDAINTGRCTSEGSASANPHVSFSSAEIVTRSDRHYPTKRFTGVNTITWACTWFTLVASMLLQGAPEAHAATKRPHIGQHAKSQIEALLAEKKNRPKLERKISSRLLYQRKMTRRQMLADGVGSLRTGVRVKSDGTTTVDIRADVNEALVAKLQSMGATVLTKYPQYGTMRAQVSLSELDQLATLPQVRFIRPAELMMTNSHDPGATNTSEADIAHRADLARTTYGVDGTGITIGVLSDGVNSLAARQASGDLPSTITVLPGQAGSGDEGTAMLEIVHDLAPGANLLFATAFGGQATFASNIQALRAAGADIIVDDVFYFAEPPFQDGIIAQAVNAVTASGALYFSSAGNSGNVNDGTAGVWEGDFSPIEAPAALGSGVIAHDFGGGANANAITKDPPFLITLSWSDPTGGSATDFDLFLLSSDLNTVLASSTDAQDGSQDPIEFIDSAGFDDLNTQLVVVYFSGDANRYLHLNTHRGRLATATPGQISGHAAAQDAFAVAAVNVATAGGGVFIGGTSNPIEIFSSDGPRRIFYDASGLPLTAGNLTATGGVIRQKPDIAAADGVSTSTPGFTPFWGTSAAAPHAAAIAALVLQANPSLSASDVRSTLTSTALDIEAGGIDRDSGYGILDAQNSVGSVAVPPTFSLTVNISGGGLGSVTSTPGGISCGEDCVELFPEGTAVTLMATADGGSSFMGWSGAECSGNGPCTVQMNHAQEVTATFVITPSLTVLINGSGQGAVVSNPAGISCPSDCTGTYATGTVITLTPFAAFGSTFSGWTGAGCSGTGPCSVSLTQAETVSATFHLLMPLSVTVNGVGTVESSPAGIECPEDCSELYVFGTTVTLTALPDFDTKFQGWSGACTGYGSCTVTLDQARHVIATFGIDFRTQVVKLTIPPGSQAATATAPSEFTPVDPSHTIALISGVTQHAMGWTEHTSQRPREISTAISLIDGWTLTATRASATTRPTSVWVLLIEYTGAVGGPNEFLVRDRRILDWIAGEKSVTYGPVSGIAEHAKVVVFGAGAENSNSKSAHFDRGDVRAWIDSSGVVHLARGDRNGAIASSHQVVEFVGGNWNIQKGEAIPSPAPNGTDISITAVGDVSTAWVYFTWSTNSANLDERGHRVWLTSPTTLRLQEDHAATGLKTIRWHVIQNPYMHVQNGAADNQFSHDLSATITGFAPVADENSAFAWVTGMTDGGGNAHPRDMWQFKLMDQATISLERGYAGQELSYHYSVVELP